MTPDLTENDAPAVGRWQQLLETKIGIPFTGGNEIIPLRNGDQIFPAMIGAIDAAESSIDFLTFVYWKGQIAHDFAAALGRAAKRGVRVRVVLDSFGAYAMESDLVDEMKNAGVAVGWFRPISVLRVGKSSHRTHRKVLICDGQVGFTGGVGIAEEWTGDADEVGSWRDTHFQVRGRAVAGLSAAFLGNWLETDGAEADVEDIGAYPRDAGSALIQVIRTTASIGWSDAWTCFRSILSSARKKVRIATPYFVPDEECLKLLCELPGRGVETEILVPGPYTDERLVRLGGKDHFQALLDAGVRIWQFQPTMFHAKILLADDELASIGSANFNHRSMRKDDEIVLNVIDEDLVAQLDSDYDGDVERSEEVDLAEWEERGFIQKTLETLTKPLQSEM